MMTEYSVILRMTSQGPQFVATVYASSLEHLTKTLKRYYGPHIEVLRYDVILDKLNSPSISVRIYEWVKRQFRIAKGAFASFNSGWSDL